MKLLKFFLALSFVAVVGYCAFAANQDSKALVSIAINNIESIAGCETSPNHSDNTGYCSKMVGGSGGSCVESGSGSEPRCSGNF